MEPKDREKQIFIANLMPARGSWLELEIDKKGNVYVRIDRKRKLPVTVLLRAMGFEDENEILALFDNSVYIRHTIEADSEPTKTEEGALDRAVQEAASGRAAVGGRGSSPDGAAVLRPERYDLTRVGRYKLNSPLDLDVDLAEYPCVLTKDDIVALIRELTSVPTVARGARGDRRGKPDQGLRGRGADLPPRPDQGSPRRVRALREPPSADGGEALADTRSIR